MEARDEEMGLFDDFSSLPFMQNKNDPWAPMKNNPTDIPKLFVALKDPLRNMINSETYVKSLGTKIMSYSCTTVFVLYTLLQFGS